MAEPITPTGRIFTATGIQGPPGVGKTSLSQTFAEYLWEVHHKVLMLYSWDGGAIPTGVQALMKKGLIRFWRVRTRSEKNLGIETLHYATRGYWPKSINPVTGETAPNVPLVAPLTQRYVVTCPKGHPMMTVPTVAQIQARPCEACGPTLIVPRDQLLVTVEQQRTKGFEDVGGVFFDGLTSMSQVVLQHMDWARGSGQIQGEKAAFGGIVESGSVKYGGNNRADVGFGQTRAQEFVMNALSIPGLVEGPVFTALTMEATDEGGLSIVGMKLPGRAATDEAASWFGNVAEMGKTLDEKERPRFTLFLRPFTDKQQRYHLLKTSASPNGVPAMLIDPAQGEGEPFSQASLGKMFRLLDEDLQKALETTIEGVPEAPSEYGDAFVQTVIPTEKIKPLVAPPAVPAAATPAAGPKPAAPKSAAPPKSAAAPVVAASPAPPVEQPKAPRELTLPKPASAAPKPATSPAAATPPPVATAAPTAAGPKPAGIAPPVGMRPPMKVPGS